MSIRRTRSVGMLIVSLMNAQMRHLNKYYKKKLYILTKFDYILIILIVLFHIG